MDRTDDFFMISDFWFLNFIFQLPQIFKYDSTFKLKEKEIRDDFSRFSTNFPADCVV
jgi:hypothetical protein